MEFRTFIKFSFLNTIAAFAMALWFSSAASAAPVTFNVDGVITTSAGTPLEEASVPFNIEIKSPSSQGSCLLYKEQFTVTMTGSNGYFSIPVGKSANVAAGAYSLEKVLGDEEPLTGLSGCSGGVTSYAPAAGEDRQIVITFTDTNGVHTFSAQDIKAVPFAVRAKTSESVAGYTPSLLMKVDSGVSQSTNTNTAMSQTQYDELWRLIKNPATAYLSGSNTAAGDVTGTFSNLKVTKLQNIPVKSGVPSANDVLRYNTGTSQWEPQALVAGSVTNVTSANNFLTVTSGTTTPSLTVNVGTSANTVAAGDDSRFTDARTPAGAAGGELSGTYPNPTIAKIAAKPLAITGLSPGQVLSYDGTSWINAAVSDSSKLPTAGGSMTGAIDMGSQNLTSTGYITMSANKSLHLSNNSVDPAGLAPADKGKIWFNSGSNEVRYWDGSAVKTVGLASGSTPDASYGTKGIVSFNTDAATSGISVSAGVAQVNYGTSANQLVRLDSSAKLPAVDGSALTNINAANLSSGILPIVRGGTNSSIGLTNGKVMVSSGGAIVEGNASATAKTASTFVMRDGSGNLAGALGTFDQLSMSASVAGAIQVAAPSTTANYTFTLPDSGGTNGYVLATNGSGTTSWIAQASGVGGSGTTGKLAKFTASGTVGDSVITESGSAIGIGTSTAPYILSLDPSAAQTMGLGRHPTANSAGNNLTLTSGNATSGATNKNGGNLILASGTATGTGSSQLQFQTASPGTSGTADRAPTTKMTIDGAGNVGIANTAPGALVDIGAAGSALGTLRLQGNTSGYVQIQPAAAAGSWTMTLPSSAGTSGYVLSTNGAGVTTWVAPGAAGTTSIANGGTGQTTQTAAFDALSPSTAKGDLAVHNGTNNVRFPAGADAFVLTADSTQPAGLKWSALPAAPGDATYAAKGLVQFSTDAATSGVNIASGVASINAGTGANQIVKLDTSSKLPAVDASALTNLNAGNFSSGILPIVRGGTNSSFGLTNNKIMISSGGSIVESAALGNGQVLIGGTGIAPTAGNITGSAGVVVTNGSNSIALTTDAVSTNTASKLVTRDGSGNFAANAITNNSNILKGSSSGSLTMTVPSTVTPYTITWPNAVGGAGTFLSTDASGVLSWTSPAAPLDASYSTKGIVQFATDAATSGISITSGVASVNAGTGANKIVKLDGSGRLPAVDGSALTSLNAGSISTGFLPVARGGTGTTGFTADKMVVANIAGDGLQSFNCNGGDYVSFTTGGATTCGTASYGNSFVKGGNYVGGNAVLGPIDGYPLTLQTNNTARMTILSTGAVGVGTTAPNGQLDVAGGSLTAGIFTNSGGSSAPTATFQNTNLNGPVARFVANGGPTSFMGGKVGIGLTTPTATLEVAGTVKVGTAGNAISAMGMCTFTGSLAGSGETNYTCTGIPGNTNVVVACSPTTALVGAAGVVFRNSGTADTVTSKATTSVSSATWNCMWMLQ